MASIAIQDLSPSGYVFFDDSENYLDDLRDDELNTSGGGWWTAAYGAAVLSNWACAATIATVAVTGAVTYGAYRGWKAA